jgi:hypothetical protein
MKLALIFDLMIFKVSLFDALPSTTMRSNPFLCFGLKLQKQMDGRGYDGHPPPAPLCV